MMNECKLFHGARDDTIRACLKEGMSLGKNGQVILSSGKKFSGKRVHSTGYLLITLKNPYTEIKYQMQLARVLCWLYHGEPPANRLYVDHINGKRTDNRETNLRWVNAVTNAKNVSSNVLKNRQAWARKIGTLNKGSCNGQAKLTEKQVKHMRRLYETGLYSMRGIGRLFMVSPATAIRIINRSSWRHLKTDEE